jgi:hypothetical protein
VAELYVARSRALPQLPRLIQEDPAARHGKNGLQPRNGKSSATGREIRSGGRLGISASNPCSVTVIPTRSQCRKCQTGG